jgi:hypothetical protein
VSKVDLRLQCGMPCSELEVSTAQHGTLSGAGYLHQSQRVEVWSRRGALFNYRFPRIAKAVGALPVDNAMIDGEAVVFRSDGHSDFAALRTRAGGEQASFVAFDLSAWRLTISANALWKKGERRWRGWLLEPTIFGSARRLRLRGCCQWLQIQLWVHST